MTSKLNEALETFLENDDEFASAIISSTNAGFSGSGYSVELFPDGTHRVLWNDAIGNRYEPTGVVMSIPQLSDEEYRDLCEVAGEDTSDENLVKELIVSGVDIMMETAHDLRNALADRLATREA